MPSPEHRRGEIWTVDFGTDPADPEQAFVRPAVIVSDDHLHHPALRMVVVVPGTTTIRSIPLHVTVAPDTHNGLTAVTSLQAEQVRAISVSRLISRLGSLGAADRHALDETVRNVLAL